MNLKELLKSKRYNGCSLARELKVSYATTHLWITGKTEPNTSTIKQIAELCEVSPTTVFNAVLKTKAEAKEANKTYGNFVAELKKANITQVEIAKCLNISETALSLKIKGKSEFKANEMFCIRDAFFPSMTVDELFER